MSKLKDRVIDEEARNICLYGPPGTGKTMFVLSGGSKVQILDTDNGTLGGLRLNDGLRDQRVEADVLSFRDSNPQRPMVFSSVKQKLGEIAKSVESGSYPFEVLVVDSFTTLADSCQEYIMGNSSKLGEPPKIQHYLLINHELGRLVSLIRSIKLVKIVVFHEETVDIEGRNVVRMSIPGQSLKCKLPRYFHEIWHSRRRNAPGGKVEYLITTHGTEAVEARTACELPETIDQSIGLEKVLEMMRKV